MSAKAAKNGGKKRKLDKSENGEPAKKKKKTVAITKSEFWEHAEPIPVKLSNGIEMELQPKCMKSGNLGWSVSEARLFPIGKKKAAVQATINATCVKSKEWKSGDAQIEEEEKKKGAKAEKGDTFTKAEFRKLAAQKLIKATMFDEIFKTEVKETKTGSLQWSGNRKAEYEVNGHEIRLQCSMNFTCKKSSEWDEGSDAEQSDEEDSGSDDESESESEDDDVKKNKKKKK